MRRRALLRCALPLASGLALAACGKAVRVAVGADAHALAAIAANRIRPASPAPSVPAAPRVPASSTDSPAPGGPAASPASPTPAAPTPARPAAAAPAPDLVPFTGAVQHLMTHPLVAYPERAFHGSMAKGYDEWFITVSEFDRLLPQVYANGYILIDEHRMFTESTTAAGQTVLTPRTLMVPKGKKPLILSVDDICYYDYMRDNGNVFRLVLDDGGDIATYSVDLAGHEVTSRDNEIVPIVDQFVEAHPDFSLDGAKGLLCLTGYQGILGYRTEDTASPQYPDQQAKALDIVARLKETGWRFGCHGWGHLNAATISYAALVADTQRWLAQVAPLTGPTDVYIYPFGADVYPGDPKFAYLLSQGFRVFYGIGPGPYLRMTSQWMAMDRVQMDGITLESQPKVLAPFFDAATVIDRQARGLPAG